MNADEQLEELQKKIQVLEGERKTFYETNKLTLKRNDEILEALKYENKELRKELQRIQKEQAKGGTYQESETAQLHAKVQQLRAAHDKLKHEALKYQKLDKSLADKVVELERESAPFLTDDSPVTRKIRMLENRLDKAMIKYNEAMSIRKTYEQIVKRLKEERIGFDNQLQAIERTLKAKQHDYQELLAMSHDANYAREVAKGELNSFRAQFEEEIRQRNKELLDRKQYVAARVELTTKISKRETTRKKIEADLKDEEDSERRASSASSQSLQQSISESKIEETQERIAEYEEALRKIKEATGVSDVNDIIKKCLTQEETHRSLEEMTKECQAKIELLNIKKAQLKAKLDEAKYSGSGSLGSRRVIDEFEGHLAEAMANCERHRQKFERIAKVLINVKAGAEHLQEKVIAIDAIAGNMTSSFEKVIVTDDNCADVFALCHSKLLTLVDIVNTDGANIVKSVTGEVPARVTPSALSASFYGNRTKVQFGGSPTDTPTNLSASASGGFPLAGASNNVRIKLPSMKDDGATTDDDGDDDEEGEEGEVLNRSQVKKLSNLAVDKNTKKLKKKKTKGGRADADLSDG